MPAHARFPIPRTSTITSAAVLSFLIVALGFTMSDIGGKVFYAAMSATCIYVLARACLVRVVLDDEGVTFHGLYRTTSFPWALIERAETAGSQLATGRPGPSYVAVTLELADGRRVQSYGITAPVKQHAEVDRIVNSINSLL